jgi:hypothetical protein
VPLKDLIAQHAYLRDQRTRHSSILDEDALTETVIIWIEPCLGRAAIWKA